MAKDHDDIRRHFESFAAALHDKDRERVMAHYAPNALAFDLAPPLQHRRADIENGLRDWFATWVSPIGYETLWFRATVCLRKLASGWKIAHEHTSVPLYMDGSFRAAVDLHP